VDFYVVLSLEGVMAPALSQARKDKFWGKKVKFVATWMEREEVTFELEEVTLSEICRC
jgi:hypothetical protein